MIEPLTYVVKNGAPTHVPAKSLTLVPKWDIQDGYIKVNVEYFLEGEMVRNDVYVYDRKGVFGSGVTAQLG